MSDRLAETAHGASPGAAGDATGNAVLDAIRGRHSVRRYLPDPVPAATLRAILEAASYTASGSNMQPWRVFVLSGGPLRALGSAMRDAFLAGEAGQRDYAYYPEKFPEPFLARRRACGWGMYSALGIAKGEAARMQAQRAENYGFFGAPAGLVFTVDGRLQAGSWVDYGGFLQSIMVAARGLGLDTCPQASIAEYPGVIRAMLPVDEGHKVLCGMALGFADPAAAVNAFRPARAGVEEFATFLD